MSKEFIRKIQEAEAEAGNIRAEASEQARELIRRAEADAVLFCERAEQNAEKENAKKLQLTRQKADELLARSEALAKEEAAEVRAAASPYTREAVRLVTEGVWKLCQ